MPHGADKKNKNKIGIGINIKLQLLFMLLGTQAKPQALRLLFNIFLII